MTCSMYRSLLLTLALAVFSSMAFTQQLYVGDLSFDNPSAGVDQLDITNFVGNGIAFNSGLDPVSASTFDIDVTSLTVYSSAFSGGMEVLPGSDFTSVDSAGDLDCNASGCNLYGDDVTSAVLTGTFSYTGLTGLDPGYTGIEDGFTTTISPTCGTTYLDDGSSDGCQDTALITATETTGATVTPEPGTWSLFGIGAIGLLLIARSKRPRRASVKPAAELKNFCHLEPNGDFEEGFRIPIGG